MAILSKENDSGNTGGVTMVTHRNSIDRAVANAVARIHNLGYDCLELSISFNDLVNKDWTPLSVVTGDTSDPICVVSTKNEQSGQWEEQGRTEIIANKTTGQFVKHIYVKYRFEQACQIKFSL